MPHADIRNQRFLKEWEPLDINGQKLTPQAFEHTDGRRHLYFLGEGETIGKRGLSSNINRIGYRTWDDGTMILGLCVSRELRGRSAGTAMVRYFADNAPRYEVPLSETAVIHKPLVALTLSRCGFQPEPGGVMAEILPLSIYDNPDVPKIGILPNQSCNNETVDQSKSGAFYELVTPGEIALRYPINNPSMVVSLHTSYLPPPVSL